MSGRELIGRRLQNGRIQYTDWGNLSLELVLGFKGEPGQRFTFAGRRDAKDRDLLAFLLNEIVRDPKGTLSLYDYAKLGDADEIWVITGQHLYGLRHRRYLTH